MLARANWLPSQVHRQIQTVLLWLPRKRKKTTLRLRFPCPMPRSTNSIAMWTEFSKRSTEFWSAHTIRSTFVCPHRSHWNRATKNRPPAERKQKGNFRHMPIHKFMNQSMMRHFSMSFRFVSKNVVTHHSHHHHARSDDSIESNTPVVAENVTSSEARNECNGSSATKDCLVTKSTIKAAAKIGQSNITRTKVAAPNNKTPVRRKVAPKQKPTVKSQPEQKQQTQQINRARGTLHGLSTLRRHGNVRVTPMTDYIAVRSNFVLGPLVLKVEKSFGRGTKRETKRATATTTQMIGRINLRIVNDSATLHSIKVQQPKQVN